MKEVLLSIQPQWCKKIARLQKTIEIRKSVPNLKTPFKCYIYCTKGKPYLYGDNKNYVNKNYVNDYLSSSKDKDKKFKETDQMYKWNGSVIGEFVCDRIDSYTAEFTENNCYEDIRLNYYDEDFEEMGTQYITSNEEKNPCNCELCKDSCVSFNEIKKYLFNGRSGFFDFYGLHISDLKFYGKPLELNEFGKYCTVNSNKEFKLLKTAPQSWCYVEKKEK